MSLLLGTAYHSHRHDLKGRNMCCTRNNFKHILRHLKKKEVERFIFFKAVAVLVFDNCVGHGVSDLFLSLLYDRW